VVKNYQVLIGVDTLLQNGTESGSYFLEGAVLDRKSSVYNRGNLTYYIYGYLYENFASEKDLENCYLQIFVYNSETSEDYPNGKLNQAESVTPQDLNISSKDFKMLDYQVYEDRIIILD
jgi:hypothetical protein